jgi:hypothetical protein
MPTTLSNVITSKILYDISLLPHNHLSLDRANHVRVNLGLSHPLANTGGWQYLSRYVVMLTIGERLHRDEHVHHINGNKLDCRRDNLEVLLAESHGRLHARKQSLYMLRDVVSGRWQPSQVPPYAVQYGESEIDKVPEISNTSALNTQLEEVPF